MSIICYLIGTLHIILDYFLNYMYDFNKKRKLIFLYIFVHEIPIPIVEH